MSILLNVTKHFLQEGIKKIIEASEQADRSLINDGRILLFKKGRNTMISSEKRAILRELVNNISTTQDAVTDEASFKLIEVHLLTALEKLEKLCADHEIKPCTTEADLSALKENFFAEMQKKCVISLDAGEMLKVDPFKVRDKKIDLDDETYDPLDVLLYYVTMYQAQIMFDEHNSFVKHSREYIEQRLLIIQSHINDYYKIVEDDIKPKHSELLKAKARSLKPQINLIMLEADGIYAQYQYRLWGGSMLTPYNDKLNTYMNQALATINNRWFIEDLSPKASPALI